MSSEIGPSWLNFRNAGPLGPTGASTANTGPTGPTGPLPVGITGTFYRVSPVQNLTSGETIIDFQTEAPWNSAGYVSRIAVGQYSIAQRGVYQLEANLLIQPNGSTNPTDLLRGVQIWINRGGINYKVLENNSNLLSGAVYSQQVVGTVGLEENDILFIQCLNTFTGGPAQVDISTLLIDLNSFFTWSLIKTY